MRELGKDRLFPLVPAERRKAPMEAAIPKHTVFISQGTYYMQYAGCDKNILLFEVSLN